jgi:hypothetical protein
MDSRIKIQCRRDEKIMESRIIQLAHLIEYLAKPNYNVSMQSKIAEIKLARDNGIITQDEAIDLATEYATINI